MQQQIPPPSAHQSIRDSHHRPSTSGDYTVPDPQGHSKNDWQTLKSPKSNKNSIHPAASVLPITTHNRFEILAHESRDSLADSQTLPQQQHKPPPIFIHGVTNYNQMITSISEVAADEQYSTKSMANNMIKLNCYTPDTYRNIVKHCKDKGIYFHTYQLKEERAFRVVLKYLHHSTDVQDIRQELHELGHSVRNIVNAHHRQSKEPLNLFFVDLEPAENNKDIYGITALQNKIITIEPPRVNKKHIPQCIRCQQYGHTRTYCNKPYACVKCGGPHSSSVCTKQTDSPAKCALCGGTHPANYKGCDHYRNISRDYNPHRPPSSKPSPTTNGHPSYHNPPPPPPPQQQRSYAEVVRNESHQPETPSSDFRAFLEECKGLFAQLLQQNTLIINMLSTLINNKH